MRLDGMYATFKDAKVAVERLNRRGYIREDLTVAMNQEKRKKLDVNFEAELAIPQRDAEKRVSLGESLKQMMSFDEIYVRDEGADFKLPSRNHKDIMKGKIGVFINTDAENPSKRILDAIKK